jgi:hypothetical protein
MEERGYERQTHCVAEERIRIERQALLFATHDGGNKIFSTILPVDTT